MKNHHLLVLFLGLFVSLPTLYGQVEEDQLNQKPSKLIQFSKSENLTINNGLNVLKTQLAPGDDKFAFQMISSEKDQLGFTYQNYQEYYQGVKVEFGIQKLHAKDGKISILSGDFYNVKNLSLSPGLDSKSAFQKVVDFVGAKHYLWEDAEAAKRMGNYKKPTGELVILPNFDLSGNFNLAYKFDIYSTDPIGRDEIYIDAQSGEILMVNAIIKHFGEHKHSGAGAEGGFSMKNMAYRMLAVGNADTRYSGSRSITTRQIGGQFTLRDNTRGGGVNTYNSGRTNSYPSTNFTDNDNNWTAAEHDNAFKDNGALDAHWGAESTYDYWITQHNRNSFNGNGAALNSWVHYDDQPGGAGYDNAFWNGSVMTYGDGNVFDILTSLDVAAHEIGHAVTSNTANLAYRRESGAMNEGYSDIWGAAVEHFTRAEGTDAAPAAAVWQIGEDLNSSGGLRSMSDPKSKGDPDTYRGTNWRPATQAEGCQSPSRQNDQCGVHTNSGVLNHWFYILVAGKTGTNDIGDSYDVSGIGMTKSAQIAYRLLNVYLGANSTFAQARASGIQSAEDIFGANSPEVISTTNAWYAVGVGAEYNGGGGTPTGCSTSIASFPYSEGFESGLGAWSQGGGDDFDWTRQSGGTPSNSTGPSGAAQGNFYVYAETSNPNNPSKTTILNSPCFDLSAESQADFTFKYQMTGNAVGNIRLEASSDEGVTWTLVWTKSGNQGSAWQSASVNLASYTGNSAQLRFVATSGTSWQGDIAIDDISLSTSGGGSTGSGCSDGISSFPYTQGFENTLGAWSQSNADDINWTLDAGGTPSRGTGPSSANQGSYYLYIEASGNGAGYPNKRAIVSSPCFDLASASQANASFKYHMTGNSVGSLNLEVSTDDGSSWASIWNRSGNQGNSWQTANIDLSAYVGGSIQLRFNGLTSTSWQGDITIDDFRLTNSAAASSFTDISGIAEQFETRIYPNPTNGSVLNVVANSLEVKYTMTSIAGHLVDAGQVLNGEIDIARLSAGVYLLQLVIDDQVITKRFIKE